MDIDKTMLDELTPDCKTRQNMEKFYSQTLQAIQPPQFEAGTTFG